MSSRVITSREKVSESVTALMVSSGMTYEQLADKFNLNPYYLKRGKLGEQRWDLDDLDLLAEIFGVEPADLIRGFELKVIAKNEDPVSAEHKE